MSMSDHLQRDDGSLMPVGQHLHGERPLPGPEKHTVYRVGRWEGGRRTVTSRPTHVFEVDRVKIGTSYKGEPIFTEYTDHRAIGCGVYLAQMRGDETVAPENVSCRKCRTRYMDKVGRRPARRKAMMTHDQELLAAIKAERRETFGTGRLRTRYRRCHEIAASAMLYGSVPEGTVMVQGTDQTIIPRRHSWLELPDGRVWCPVTCQFGSLDILHVDARFTAAQVAEQLARSGYYGWWAETDSWSEAQRARVLEVMGNAGVPGRQ